MGHWLSQQYDLPSEEHDPPLKLVMTWDLIHVNTRENWVYFGNSFSISESEALGISCHETPSLSLKYPSRDKAAVILSRRKRYWSATFVKVIGQEYLAASCNKDGCLYFWDMESGTYKKVFDPKLPEDQEDKDMNIFRINDNTIGYGESYASPDGSRRVFILQTDKEELTLSSTLRLFTSRNIFDTCYTEVEGGAPCLLLCVPYDNRIMSVETIGGKIRWEVGKEQMGEKFFPLGICTDDDNTVYVTDYYQHNIHMLSAEDGSVIRSINTFYYGIGNLIAVRFHNQHLYVEHYTNPGYKYAISKFKRNV